MKTIIVDMDGTICEERPTFERPLADILPGAYQTLHDWKCRGHTVIIYTTRSWSEYKMTMAWLHDHGIYPDQLVCGKPLGDVWVDDRALRFTSWQDMKEAIDEQKEATSQAAEG